MSASTTPVDDKAARIAEEVKRADALDLKDYIRYDEKWNEIYVRGHVIFTKKFQEFQATIKKTNPTVAEPTIVLIGETTLSTL
jgi:hypothetical protein